MQHTAYIALWYPKPSETFVFGEVAGLRALGLPVTVFTLYGPLSKDLSSDMADGCAPTIRLGMRSIPSCLAAAAYWRKKHPARFKEVARKVLLRRWRDLEQTGENSWAFFAGCRLAKLFQEQDIRHIHAGWANGPATAAWTASMLTDIPFSFTGRAGDIYPPDGALKEKLADAAFARVDAAFNIDYLRQFTPDKKKAVHLVRNMLSWNVPEPAPLPMKQPFRILAVARFVKTKGLDVLLKACRLLDREGIDFRLTLAGSGQLDRSLRVQAQELGIADKVHFPGFVLHNQVPDLIREHDILVMPSKVRPNGDRDGLPTVIMEALLTRVPVVATDVGGIRELIHDGETGLLIQQRDPRAMANAIRQLAGNREMAIDMAERGKQLVIDYYDTAKNSRTFYDLIVANMR